MNLQNSDAIRGKDLQPGDVVFIKFEVLEPATAHGDVKLRYYARDGHNEYAAKSVNSIFIKRSRFKLIRKLVNYLFK
jgi:hypothetical protein